ncbi:uncharacterized protein F5Z01DRAFT_279646 [Emericellopsis atlantica]|uniref:Uncharacterized protein n=1 Tax=Emericellopsis atlantica TaxID=2614577 RepID=A0A9P7ZG03_9HYPO|nr:uncharacterized protein F5Z01DRAFT_279646 [Emericellopsis atlantica]KAG9251409.1 hypothetical protein F5Z01DRAFT_279646 [Emericellopsis atlantica]
MASAAAKGAVQESRSQSASRPSTTDPILRNTLRYTVSADEYAALHKYIISRSRALRRATPSPTSVEKALRPKKGKDDYNVRAVRDALRVFVVTWLGMKGWDAVSKRFQDSKEKPPKGKTPFYKSPALRLSLSLSSILFLYRILFRFLNRLRSHLLTAQVEPFRRRNPRATATLTSPYAPAVGASLAGLALGVYPSAQLRVSVAILAMFRALEFGWNMCEGEGLVWGVKGGRLRERPWWFGSWMLQPLAFGQLFHATVFDPECVPAMFKNFLYNNTTAYLHSRPIDWPAHLKWPSTTQVFENIAEMAKLNWPAYISPTLFPNKIDVLPPTLTGLSPLTSRAHPLISSLSCATLHPTDPSCARTYLTFWINSFPPLTRLFLVAFSALKVLPRLKSFYHSPLATLHTVISTSLRMSTFLTGAMSTAWASICFFQNFLPRHVLSTQRFFLGGFFAGLWAWVERRHGRSAFLYTARMSVDSLWKVGVKRRWWKAMRGGDVWVFVLALMVTGVVYERDAKAIREAQWRKGLSFVRGQTWRDWSVEDENEDVVGKEE